MLGVSQKIRGEGVESRGSLSWDVFFVAEGRADKKGQRRARGTGPKATSGITYERELLIDRMGGKGGGKNVSGK